MVYTLIGILLEQQQENEANSMTDKERRVIRFRQQDERRKRNEPHDPERRAQQDRRDKEDRRNR